MTTPQTKSKTGPSLGFFPFLREDIAKITVKSRSQKLEKKEDDAGK